MKFLSKENINIFETNNVHFFKFKEFYFDLEKQDFLPTKVNNYYLINKQYIKLLTFYPEFNIFNVDLGEFTLKGKFIDEI